MAFTTSNPNHGMYKVSRVLQNGKHLCSIILVSDFRHSIHLIPHFSKVAPAHWTSSNMLKQCDSFYVNPFSDRHTYMTII